jgi:hypothetical protein
VAGSAGHHTRHNPDRFGWRSRGDEAKAASHLPGGGSVAARTCIWWDRRATAAERSHALVSSKLMSIKVMNEVGTRMNTGLHHKAHASFNNRPQHIRALQNIQEHSQLLLDKVCDLQSSLLACLTIVNYLHASP